MTNFAATLPTQISKENGDVEVYKWDKSQLYVTASNIWIVKCIQKSRVRCRPKKGINADFAVIVNTYFLKTLKKKPNNW